MVAFIYIKPNNVKNLCSIEFIEQESPSSEKRIAYISGRKMEEIGYQTYERYYFLSEQQFKQALLVFT